MSQASMPQASIPQSTLSPTIALLLLKMRLLICMEFQVRLELYSERALHRFLEYGQRSQQRELRAMAERLADLALLQECC